MTMICLKKIKIITIFLLGALCGSAQVLRQFNGVVNIDQLSIEVIIPGVETRANMTFTDPAGKFSGLDTQVGDHIIDAAGNGFEVTIISYADGGNLKLTVKSLDGVDLAPKIGVLYRPTSKGINLLGLSDDPTLVGTVVNSALLQINNSIPLITSGTVLPTVTTTIGTDAIYNGSVYQYTGAGWVIVTSIPSVFSLGSGNAGDVVVGILDGVYYVCTGGSSWNPIPTVTALPIPPKLGDIFYNTSENKLYMMGNSGVWMAISGSSIPVGPISDRPTSPKSGDFFFDKVDNVLYVYDALNRWVVVSINGSTPTGILNPDPLATTVKEGELFYNTTDKKLYFYNGTAWAILSNSLMSGQIFIGNSSNVPVSVPLSGDATINYLGKLTINAAAVTDSKLDKANIPISGFGYANNNIVIGTGSPFYQIKGIANPTNPEDVSTKSYVDLSFSAPVLLGLANNSVFVGNSSNKAAPILKSAVPISDFGKAVNALSMGTSGGPYYNISNMANPAALQDAATKYYVDNHMITPTYISLANNQILVGTAGGVASAVLKSAVSLSDFGAATADILMGGKNLKNLHEPVNPQDAATMNYVDSKTLSLTSNYVFQGDGTNAPVGVPKTSIHLNEWGAATASVNMGGTNLNNLADPVALQDAATKKYVDGKNGSITTAATTPAVGTLGTTYYNTTDKTFYISDGTQWLPVNNILPTGQLYVGDAANKAVATAKSSIPLSGFGAPIADIAAGAFKITGLADPTNDQDAATKKYIDNSMSNVITSIPLAKGNMLVGDASGKAASIAKSTITLSGFGDAEANISMGTGSNNYKIINVANPTGDQDAATKYYVDKKVITPTSITLTTNYILVGNASNQATAVAKSNVSLSEFGAITGNLTLAGYQITNLADPVTAQDAVTKKYVDTSLASFSSSPSLTQGYLFVGDATNKAVATAKNAIPVSGFAAAAADVDFGSHKLVNVTDPSGNQDAATKNYVDTKVINPANITLASGKLFVGDASGKAAETLKSAILLSGFGTAAADLDLGSNKIINLTDPTGNQDAATKNYVDTKPLNPANIALSTGKIFVGNASGKAAETSPGTISLSAFGLPTADVDLGTHKLINLVDPLANQDASTKKYVDVQVAANKLAPIGAYTILGNNTASTTDAIALTPLQIKSLLTLDQVDNTKDINKNVLSATILTNARKINNVSFDGSIDITIPGDDMGNHTATKNLKMGTFAVNYDGLNGKGVTFETSGNATFAQDVTVNGNFYTPSDQQLKTNIVTLGNALQAIDSMRGVRFEYKDQKKYAKGPKIGVIAQELIKVFPEMVTKGADGFFKVDYTQLSAVLIQAIKEQQKLIHQQQLEINDLKDRLDKQQLQINAILKKLN